MKFYETLYIVHPALESGRLKDIILDIESMLKNNGGDVVSTDIWGKKKLAYLIDKQKYGTYVLIQFKSDGSGNSQFNMNLEHNPNILRYLTTKIDESDIVTDLDDIDAQLNTGHGPDGSDKTDKPLEATASDSTKSSDEKAEATDSDSTASDSTESSDEKVEATASDSTKSSDEKVEATASDSTESSDEKAEAIDSDSTESSDNNLEEEEQA